MSTKHHILFDLDGTLTDSFKGIAHSVQYALSRYGIVENDLHKLTPFIGPPLTYSFREFYHFSDAQADEAVSYYREYFSNKGWLENTAYPGIPEMLQTLRGVGKHLYVATSKPTEFAVRILEHFGLSVFFDYIGGASFDRSRESKVEVMRYLCQLANITDMDSAIMVGDRKFDVSGAHAIGMECVGVLYGYGSEAELSSVHADRLVSSVTELTYELLAKV